MNEDDLDTVMAKLIDEAARFNIQRYQYVTEIKVKLPEYLVFMLLLLFQCPACVYMDVLVWN